MIAINTNKVLNAPELHISIFAVLLNFVWELLQMPLFAGFADFQHYQATLHRTKATFGDVVISLVAFAGACLIMRSRMRIKLMNKSGVVAFLAMGLVITIVFELLATGPLKRMILKHVILIFRTGLNFKGNRLSGSMSTVAPFLSIPRMVKKYQSNGIMFTVKNDSPFDNAPSPIKRNHLYLTASLWQAFLVSEAPQPGPSRNQFRENKFGRHNCIQTVIFDSLQCLMGRHTVDRASYLKLRRCGSQGDSIFSSFHPNGSRIQLVSQWVAITQDPG